VVYVCVVNVVCMCVYRGLVNMRLDYSHLSHVRLVYKVSTSTDTTWLLYLEVSEAIFIRYYFIDSILINPLSISPRLNQSHLLYSFHNVLFL